MLPPRVRLIVLNYNGAALIERCVQHLEALAWPEDRLDLVVVDNCSSDGSDVTVERDHPRVRVVRSPKNAGFPANNLALRDLDDVDYVGLVNNDAYVEPDMLRPLVAALEADATLGAVCPRIVLEPRFSSLRLTAPTWVPPGDGRALSVRVEGLRVDGLDRFDAAVFGAGCFDLEHGERGEFRWLGGTSLVHVPSAGSDEPRAVSVLLSCPHEQEVTLEAGAAPVTMVVDDRPTWVEVQVSGPT